MTALVPLLPETLDVATRDSGGGGGEVSSKYGI